MKPICEVVVKEVLPAVRTVIIKDLLDAGMNQRDVAERLNLSQPSVSQHLRKIRGKNVGLLRKNKKIQKMLSRAAEKIAKKGESHLFFCEICAEIRRKGMLCRFHKRLLKTNKCNVCLTKNVCVV